MTNITQITASPFYAKKNDNKLEWKITSHRATVGRKGHATLVIVDDVHTWKKAAELDGAHTRIAKILKAVPKDLAVNYEQVSFDVRELFNISFDDDAAINMVEETEAKIWINSKGEIYG